MSKIAYFAKIVETIKMYSIEKGSNHSNIYIFDEIKFKHEEALYIKIFKQINFLKLFLIFLLNLILFIVLMSNIIKVTKEKYDPIISLFFLFSLILGLAVYFIMMNFFSSITTKKKILLYCFYGINLILITLIIYFSLKNENQKTLFHNENSLYFKKVSDDVSVKKYMTERHFFNFTGNITSLKNDNFINFNNNQKKNFLKILQFNNFNELLKNETLTTQYTITDNNQNKKDLLLIFNISIYLLYLLICFGDSKTLILTILFNFIINIVFYFIEINLDQSYIFIHVLINSIFMFLMSLVSFLYLKLLEVMDYNIFIIKFLLENFYSNLTKFGIFHTVMAQDVILKNADNQDLNLTQTKSLLGKSIDSFTSGKKSLFKKSRKNIKKLNKSKNRSLNYYNTQTHQNLMKNSISPRSKNLGESRQNEKVKRKLSFSNKLNEHQNYRLKNNIVQNEENYKIKQDNSNIKRNSTINKAIINKIGNENYNLNHNKTSNIVKFSLRKIEKGNENFDKLLSESNLIPNLNNIQDLPSIEIENLDFKNKEEKFNPYLVISSLYKATKDLNDYHNHNLLEVEMFDINDLLSSPEISSEKLIVTLKDLVKFNFNS